MNNEEIIKQLTELTIKLESIIDITKKNTEASEAMQKKWLEYDIEQKGVENKKEFIFSKLPGWMPYIISLIILIPVGVDKLYKGNDNKTIPEINQRIDNIEKKINELFSLQSNHLNKKNN